MAKKYIPAWQRTVLAALAESPWEELKPDEQQALRAFVAEKKKTDQAGAEALLTQTLHLVKPRKALTLGFIILLWMAALLAAPMLCFAFGTKWLAPALAVCLVTELCGAKSARMRRLWTARTPGSEGASAALAAMYRTTLRSPLAATDKVKLTVMLLALLLLAATWFLPEQEPAAAGRVANMMSEVTAGKAALADALPLLPEGLEGIETIKKAMKYTAHGSDEEFLLAALMWRHIGAGDLSVSDYATGAAGKPMYEVLENTAPAQIDNPEEIAALALLLKHAGAQRGETTLQRFLKEKKLPDSILAVFGSAMKGERSLSQLLTLCDAIAAAGHDPLPFLREGVGSVTCAEGESLIASIDDAAHRRLLIRSMAPGFTDVDDVLAFLRLAKAEGVSAAECYPEGALINLDTSKWDPYTSPQAGSLGKRDTFLVLRRTEKPEPFTSFVVPEAEETGFDGALPDGLYDGYDPDEDTGAAQYTIHMEVSVLDRMPPERIPQSFEDCDALVFLDEWYFCDGYVRFSHGLARGAWQGKQSDSPTFGLCQEIAVYSARSGAWLFSYKENVTYSPAMLETDPDVMSQEDWRTVDHYIAAMDDAWMTRAYADFLFSLERRGWLLVP